MLPQKGKEMLNMNDTLCVYTLRCLSLDMIDKANSGHPGMALGSAPILHTIYPSK